MQEHYHPQAIEEAAQQRWEDAKIFRSIEDDTKPKYYCLSMFPYPSGNLHIGHARNYTLGDVLTRYKRMSGFNVLQPMGWDAFGMPAETAAIKHGIAPAKWIKQNIQYMRQQIKRLGCAIDWSREIATCDPEYYRWGQWLFVQLFKKGLVYRKDGAVNWDPVDQTVLANEQVVDGCGWRSGAPVEKRSVPMYYLRITDYADELLADLTTLDWPAQVIAMQKNWIGKSKGALVTFDFDKESIGESGQLDIYTTTLYTLLGVTYITISAEHPLALRVASNNATLAAFLTACQRGSVSTADLDTQKKEGLPTGFFVIHPLTHEKLPVWVANHLLMDDNAGVVMGAPAHNETDFEWAHRYHLPIKVVMTLPDDAPYDPNTWHKSYKGHKQSRLINAGKYNGLNLQAAQKAILADLVANHHGKQHTQLRLRDWGISRQRYWGCPIPIIHCDHCGEVPVPPEDLPVVLPTNLVPDGYRNPLASYSAFYKTTCPVCNQPAKRETDTMDTFVDSSWYFARYASPDCQTGMVDKRADYWMSVDQYIGGIEHAVLHLLYARFFQKLMRDEKLLAIDEPFKRLLTQGMVLHDAFFRDKPNGTKDWIEPSQVEIAYDKKGKIVSARHKTDGLPVQLGGMIKMSKSKNNGIDPQRLIDEYGADATRLFILFAAPPNQSLEWSEAGIKGSLRFINRLWKTVYDFVAKGTTTSYQNGNFSHKSQKVLRQKLHATIQKIAKDYDHRQQFNTAVAAIMELLNLYEKTVLNDKVGRMVAQETLETMVLLLSPVTPHVCESLWEALRPGTSLLEQSWPQVDPQALEQDTVPLIIQINGKLRGKINVPSNATQAFVEKQVLANPDIKRFIGSEPIKKIVYIPNKLINIVI